MSQVVGIRFKRVGKVHYFDPADLVLKVNDFVVVQTERGPELGRVVIAPNQVLVSELAEPQKAEIRLATPEDLKRAEEWREKIPEAIRKCQELISKHHLPMKLLAAEYNLDGSHLTFFFSAEGRVDFREMVKEMGCIFKTRVELRQVGPRDETKLCGGYGRCGLVLCCARHLTGFHPVSIKMAKEQELPLHPTRISGICGRLLCCLAYEYQQYLQMKESLPPAGQQVITPMGAGTVVGGNPLKETVQVQLESQATAEFPLSQMGAEGKRPPEPDRSRRRRKKTYPPSNTPPPQTRRG